MVGIPKKALNRSKLTFGKPVGDGSHKVWQVTYIDEIDGTLEEGFFKELEPDRNFPELLAEMSIGTSVALQLFQERTAKEHMVYNDEGQAVGIFSRKLKDFRPFNIKGEPIPTDSVEKEQVIPSTETLIFEDMIAIMLEDWFLNDNDPHPHNRSLKGRIDYDMFWYWFVIFMKGARPGIELPKTRVDLTVRDYERCPCYVDAKPYHSPTFAHPGQGSITVLVPEVVQASVLPSTLPKVYADPEKFARLAASPEAQAQKVAAALKIVLTYQPEVFCKRLFDEFEFLDENEYKQILKQYKSLVNWAAVSDGLEGEKEGANVDACSPEKPIKTTAPFNYTSLGPTLREKYEQTFPHLCNEETNKKAFIHFMMQMFQMHYDNFYRVVIFYMGCENNGFGVPLLSTNEELFRKPSLYKNIQAWVINQNEEEFANDPACQYKLEDLHKRYHQVWRDAYAIRLKALLRDARNLTGDLGKLATDNGDVEGLEAKDATDNSLTDSWQLFGPLKSISIDAKRCVDNESKLNKALDLMIQFTNQFQTLVKAYYYDKKRDDLLDSDNVDFTKGLLKLCLEYDDEIMKSLAHTTSHSIKFARIIRELQEFAEQAKFTKHLLSTDEQMLEVRTSGKKELLPLTHVDVIAEFNEKLFDWVDTLPAKLFKQYIEEVIDKKYAPTLELFSLRKRADPVKKYLSKSTESNRNKLAYILSSGNEEGALNTWIIRELTPQMLQTNYIASVTTAVRNGSFEDNINVFTKAAANCAKNSSTLVHLYSSEGVSRVYNMLYQWADKVASEGDRLRLIKNAALKKYEEGLSKWSFWGTSRKEEINNYFRQYDASKALAMAFMNGELTSTASSQLLLHIIREMQRDISVKPELRKISGYALIDIFNTKEDESECKEQVAFYLSYLKGKHTVERTHTLEKNASSLSL